MKLRANSILAKTPWLALASLLILIATATYGAWYANLTNITNADHLIYPYLLKNLSANDLVVPADHANFLKYPLFYLQSLAPYNIYTVTIVNIALSVATVTLWALLATYLFGRKYFALICLVLSSILGSSILLNYELLGTTIRNIEYPIALAFLIVLAKFITSIQVTKLQILGLILLSLFYSLAVASDSLLLYAISTPLAVILGLGYRFQKMSTKKRALMALGILVASTLFALLVRRLSELLGFATLYKNEQEQLTTIPFNTLVPSALESVHQFIDLTGGNIFGQVLSAGLLLNILNLILAFVGVTGIILILKNIIKKSPYRLNDYSPDQSFVLTVLALSFFITWVVYVLLDLVLRTTSDGSLVSAGQDRYLTLLPFITVLGSVFVIRTIKIKRFLLITPLAIIAILIISLPAMTNLREYQYNEFGAKMKNSLRQISKIIDENKVDTVLSGYWYGASTKFYANNSVDFATITTCNHPAPTYNYRRSFYSPSQSTLKSAIIIDRDGPDSPYWSCTDEQLHAIYGEPVEKTTIDGVNSSKVQILIYNYDLRSRLRNLP